MSISSKFAMRFMLSVNGSTFETTVQCRHITEACAKLESMRASTPPAALTDVLITLALNNPKTRQPYRLDYESRALYARFVRDFLQLAPGQYYDYSMANGMAAAMNSWDEYWADSSEELNLHWRDGFSAFDLEMTTAKVTRLVEALLRMQTLAYFQRVEHRDMDEEDLWDSEEVPLVLARRVEWLCAAGCWPVAEGPGTPIPETPSAELRGTKRVWPAIPAETLQQMLKAYRTAEIPAHFLLA